MSAEVKWWLPHKPSRDLERGLERLATTEGVRRVAVMPDAHVAEDVCIGTVTATDERILPAAVGSDIGCGMLAIRFDLRAEEALTTKSARLILDGLSRRVPWHRHRRLETVPLPDALLAWPLSSGRLEAMKEREARLELGTLGRGNHFVELQRDEAGWLWLMLHSGSRAMGPAIRGHHERAAPRARSGLAWLEADSESGRAYLSDAAWASAYAHFNRRCLMDGVAEVLSEAIGAEADPHSIIECDHNHVRCECHEGAWLWVHRKGALSVPDGVPAVIPGSMGSASHHVRGRGLEAALASASHGAGRMMSRSEARRRITRARLERETRRVLLDDRIAHRLVEEAPSAYKDISEVMRAQRDLVRIERRLEPILAYKAP